VKLSRPKGRASGEQVGQKRMYVKNTFQPVFRILQKFQPETYF